MEATEQMNGREAIGRSCRKGSFMKASCVDIKSETPGLALATNGHPNFIKTLNPIAMDTGSAGPSKLVLFIVPSLLSMLTIMSMAFFTATTT